MVTNDRDASDLGQRGQIGTCPFIQFPEEAAQRGGYVNSDVIINVCPSPKLEGRGWSGFHTPPPAAVLQEYPNRPVSAAFIIVLDANANYCIIAPVSIIFTFCNTGVIVIIAEDGPN